ncbi:peptidase [Azoarcus communis]|uniref:Peptidase n=2 Tax=Parazoarcus communis TaxID=41977 RepID=A0A323UR58_9RHOO|nr:M48 family metalloprotease [Parazoarcus communis SWub3 = DSM 12120]PZA15512.1 peptidase [Azoarcus communis] [Parazoarcus communis SWub3 = DSM 12120]
MQARRYSVLAMCSVMALAGCKTSGTDLGGMLDAGASLMTAATLSDGDVKTLGDQTIAHHDKKNRVASAGSHHAKRLAGLTAGWKEVEGRSLEYKVYISPEVNAFAVPNGSIRFYSGLLDSMTDDEVRYVIAHEIGHVVLGHSKKALQVEYATLAARQAGAASGNTAVSAMSSSSIGELGQALIGAQFSQSQENEADDFAVDLLKKTGKPTGGAVTALRKLEKLHGNQRSMFSSHPAPGDRAKRLEARIASK